MRYIVYKYQLKISAYQINKSEIKIENGSGLATNYQLNPQCMCFNDVCVWFIAIVGCSNSNVHSLEYVTSIAKRTANYDKIVSASISMKISTYFANRI